MTIQELEQKLNECQKELAELKESKKEGKWKPKVGDTYYYRTEYSGISRASFTSDLDELRYRNTLLFPTYEECLRYCRFMDTVKEKSYEFSKEEFSNGSTCKYFIAFDHKDNRFFVNCFNVTKYLGTTYFKTEEDAKYIIDNFKDELMEYWI
jgi:hypothetical protein